MAFYDEMAVMALEMITEFGQPVIIRANTAADDAYDFKVAVRNTVIKLTDSNFNKPGKLKCGVKYAKPLTKTERDQNFNVNGMVAGKDYVGGRFRGNWQFSVGSPVDGVLDQIAVLFPLYERNTKGALTVVTMTPVDPGPGIPDDTMFTVPVSFMYRADTN